MSDFTAIGQLVTEARNLLDSIKGGAIRTMQTAFEKMKVVMNDDFSNVLSEIQGRANAVLKPTNDTMKTGLSQIVYVDGVDGDNRNLGTEANPLQSIEAALGRALPCGMMRVYLKRGQRFEGPVSQYKAGIVSLIFDSYGGDEDSNPVVYPTKQTWDNQGQAEERVLACFVRSQSAQTVNIAFMNVDVETLQLTASETPFNNYGAFFSRGGGQHEMFDFNVTFFKSTVTIFDTPLFGGYAGFIKLRLVKAEINKAEGSKINQLYYSNTRQCPKIVDAQASRFIGFDIPTPEAVLGIQDNNSLVNLTGVIFE